MGAKVDSADARIATLASRQHGVVSVGQLRELGVSRSEVRRRVDGGRLHRLHRGVYAVGHVGLASEGRWMAAVLACRGMLVSSGDQARRVARGGRLGGQRGEAAILDHWGAAISHRSAACLWQLLPPREGPVDVSVPTHGGRVRRSGIRLHRSVALQPADVTLRAGIPVTTPTKTIADLRRASRGGSRLIPPRDLRRAIRQADVLGLPVGADEKRDRTRSDLERDFLRLCRRRRLPVPEVNVRVGPHLVDFLWRDRELVVETDGYRYHRGRAAFEDDRATDLSLRGLGYDVMRIADSQLGSEPESIADLLEARLARRSARRPGTRQAAP